jgi:two-component system, LytTR family, response regulator LytT
LNGARFRTLVVEDEWAARDYLVELLHASGLAQVLGAVGSAEEARRILCDGRAGLELVFLDIRLSGRGNEGLELAREIARLSAPPLVVLATAFNARADEVYDIGVADYLLKPFTVERVELCLKRLRARHAAPPPVGPVRIVARRQRSLVFFDAEDVWAFEGADRLTRVHTAHGIFDVDLSLSAIEASFGSALTRVHRNWLVNVAHVKEFEHGGETRVWVGVGMAADGHGLYAPVARDRARQLRDVLVESAVGLRVRRRT